MCGRFANHVTAMHDWTAILKDWPAGVVAGFNVVPSQIIATFTPEGSLAARWGLVPPWSQTVSSKYATFNARLESVAEKPAFRAAWSHGQRCLIPALGYYEWKTEEGGKQPYFVHGADGGPLVFAGLYEPGRGYDIPASCTIITRPADAELVGLHARMPVMLAPAQSDDWLHGPLSAAMELALGERPAAVDVYPVSREVNNPRHQGADLIRRLDQGFENQ